MVKIMFEPSKNWETWHGNPVTPENPIELSDLPGKIIQIDWEKWCVNTTSHESMVSMNLVTEKRRYGKNSELAMVKQWNHAGYLFHVYMVIYDVIFIYKS